MQKLRMDPFRPGKLRRKVKGGSRKKESSRMLEEQSGRTQKEMQRLNADFSQIGKQNEGREEKFHEIRSYEKEFQAYLDRSVL